MAVRPVICSLILAMSSMEAPSQGPATGGPPQPRATAPQQRPASSSPQGRPAVRMEEERARRL